MRDYFEYIVIFALLLTGFGILFQKIRWVELATRLMRQTREGMDDAARKRLLSKRRRLLSLQQDHSIWYRLEQELNYCGLRRRFPSLTSERWVLGNVVLFSFLFAGLLLLRQSPVKALLGVLALAVWEYLGLRVCKASEGRSVSNNLLEFLNFLGNYSVTAGEVTSVFDQISKYVEEPMKSALEECCYEAQTTGDAGAALLSMAEKIEHPKFKELVHNMEVSIRYCADFTILVNTSRRSVREYLRMGEERRSMLREALINMLLLLAMSVVSLITVDALIDRSVWEILFFTVPGKIALAIVGIIFLLLTRRLLSMNQ